MPSDYRYDPFSDTSNFVSVTDELHIIPTVSPFTIRLSEVPDKTAALTMKVRDSLASAIITADSTSIAVANGAWFANGNVITVDSEQMLVGSVSSNTLTVTRGYNSTVATTHTIGTAVFIENSMTKVSASPSSGQFWPDYSTGADNDENWNTGTILFNSNDAGKTVVVSYNGMGTLASADSHGSQLFTANGTFTVPNGVTQVRLTGIAGGGAGGGGGTGTGGGSGACCFGVPLTVSPNTSYTITIGNGGAGVSGGTGGAGGVTSFGALLSLSGGSGGIVGGDDSATTYAGGSGGSGGTFIQRGNDGSSGSGGSPGKAGAYSPFGVGGAGGADNNNGNPASGYGSGGGGAGYYGNNTKLGGAGARGFLFIEW